MNTASTYTLHSFHQSKFYFLTQPVGVQNPFTSSQGEFPDYWDWLWCPGLPPLSAKCWCPLPFPFAFHISVFFHSLFFTCHSYDRRIRSSAPIRSTIRYL